MVSNQLAFGPMSFEVRRNAETWQQRWGGGSLWINLHDFCRSSHKFQMISLKLHPKTPIGVNGDAPKLIFGHAKQWQCDLWSLFFRCHAAVMLPTLMSRMSRAKRLRPKAVCARPAMINEVIFLGMKKLEKDGRYGRHSNTRH